MGKKLRKAEARKHLRNDTWLEMVARAKDPRAESYFHKPGSNKK
jgi:hypothetical protein